MVLDETLVHGNFILNSHGVLKFRLHTMIVMRPHVVKNVAPGEDPLACPIDKKRAMVCVLKVWQLVVGRLALQGLLRWCILNNLLFPRKQQPESHFDSGAFFRASTNCQHVAYLGTYLMFVFWCANANDEGSLFLRSVQKRW